MTEGLRLGYHLSSEEHPAADLTESIAERS